MEKVYLNKLNVCRPNRPGQGQTKLAGLAPLENVDQWHKEEQAETIFNDEGLKVNFIRVKDLVINSIDSTNNDRVQAYQTKLTKEVGKLKFISCTDV